ncbi:MAG TPA: 4'-phosphopantetheinyl transferase superfamily protein [Gammaproteobacteria bacterium]
MINVHYTQANLELFSPADLESTMTGWLAELPESKRLQIERIRVFQARLCSLLGLQLLKIAMHQAGYNDFSLSRVLFEKNRKPHCPGFPDFNISHSHDLIACAVAGHGNIGVDVEQVREIQMGLDRIMSPAEQKAVQAEPQRFFHFWTQKEAVIKADGTGGVWSMEEVSLSGLGACFRNRQWYLTPLSLPGGYTGYFATDLPGQEYSVKNQAMTILLPTLGIDSGVTNN